MSDTNADTIDDLAVLIRLLADAIPALQPLSLNIDAVRGIHTDDWARPMTDQEQTAFLKALTGDLVRLNVNLSCYPVGYTTTLLFDKDGNPV